MIKKIMWFIKKYSKEIVLALLGLAIGIKLTGRKRELELSKKIEETIRGGEEISAKEKTAFKEQLDRINGITNDEERMEAKLRLWESLNE